jgi:hypothetical protein
MNLQNVVFNKIFLEELQFVTVNIDTLGQN